MMAPGAPAREPEPGGQALRRGRALAQWAADQRRKTREDGMKQGDAEGRVQSGEAWRDFCRALEAAGEVILREDTPGAPLHRAEGWRYLSRLLRAGLESRVEAGNPCYPRFFQLANETIKIGNDNPDNIYHNANISGAYEYRIRGNRGSVPYLSFGAKGGGYEQGGVMTPTGQLDLDEIACDAAGDFEIIASTKEQPGNWLPMQAHTTSLVVRQTFGDRKRETPAHYRIECLNPDRDDQLDAAFMARALADTAAFVGGTASLFVDWMQRFAEHENALPPNDQEMCLRAGGDANIHYHNSRWRLAEGEALLIEFTPPECSTWNFQVSNYWMESLDYRYHRIHVNKFTAHYEADASVRIVLAHRDPGPAFPNYLETCGHDCGAMLLRYVGARSFPPVATRVLTLEALAAAAQQAR